MKNNFKWPRLLVIIAAISLAGALFLPIWRIELSAPQYPEGLALKIYANKLAGNVDVINGLNHYIGMKTLHTDDFVEFTLLPYIIGAFVVLGLLAAFVNKRKVYYAYIATFILFGIVSMIDFYRWNYNYGHDLDPHAAIRVPGMAYQPPLIGYKQLLNFGAYSIPDKGGWMFIGAGVLLLIAYLLILKPKWLPFQKKTLVPAFVLMLSLQSCSGSGPQPIKYGSDACDNCKMTIMDKRFANEWVTDKSKVYRFDDVHCLVAFSTTNDSKGTAYINDYTGSKELVKATEMLYVQSPDFKSPMGGNIAAVTNTTAIQQVLIDKSGKQLDWDQVQKEMKK
jgi:copper chaperone NosL